VAEPGDVTPIVLPFMSLNDAYLPLSCGRIRNVTPGSSMKSAIITALAVLRRGNRMIDRVARIVDAAGYERFGRFGAALHVDQLDVQAFAVEVA